MSALPAAAAAVVHWHGGVHLACRLLKLPQWHYANMAYSTVYTAYGDGGLMVVFYQQHNSGSGSSAERDTY
jgi:hypothetical protein